MNLNFFKVLHLAAPSDVRSSALTRQYRRYKSTKMTLYKSPSVMTARKVERMTAIRRAEEQRIADLSRYSQQSRWLSNCAEKESMVENAREANLKARQAVEEQKRTELLEKQEARQRELASNELERQLIEQLKRDKKERDRFEREMQRICDTSEELKDLERQIKMAYVKKERAAQHQEALLLRKLEGDREQAMEELIESNRQLGIHRQEELESERRKKLSAQKELLQKQMLEREVRTNLSLYNLTSILISYMISFCRRNAKSSKRNYREKRKWSMTSLRR